MSNLDNLCFLLSQKDYKSAYLTLKNKINSLELSENEWVLDIYHECELNKKIMEIKIRALKNYLYENSGTMSRLEKKNLRIEIYNSLAKDCNYIKKIGKVFWDSL